MNLHNKTKKISRIFLFFALGAGFLSSCGNSNNNEGFDKTSYDISANNDGSIISHIIKINGGYSITINGSGKTKDFKTGDTAPWYSISKLIKKVEIEDGINYLGDEIFKGVSLDYFILPSSVNEISSSAFESSTSLYSYAESVSTTYDISYFSESKPTDDTKTYWHFVNDTPQKWVLDFTKVLFIGNSFTYYNDLPLLSQEIAQNLGYDFISDSVTVGSHTLEQYASSSDEYGAIVEEKLTNNNDYTYVILQEQSTRSYSNFDSFKSSVGLLKDKISATQKSAKVRLYETWGFASEAEALKITIPEMEEKIRNSYDSVGETYGIGVHYVGKAFSEVYTNYSTIDLYNESDRKHPSLAGSYLSALVHVGSIFNCDVRAVTFNSTLTDEVATTLKEVAYKIVSNK